MTKKSLPDVESMTPEQLAQVLRNIKIMETWIHAVKGHAFEVLKAGGSIPGFKLGYGAKRRIWKEGTEAQLVAALKASGVDKDELYTAPAVLSPPKVEKLLKEKGVWPKKARGAQRPPTPIDPFVDYSMPEPRVMALNDRDDPDAKFDDAYTEFS